MTTNTRLSHTGCDHEKTSADRAKCRKITNRILRDAREAYINLADDYEEHVCRVALRLGVEVHEAYTIVEEG